MKGSVGLLDIVFLLYLFPSAFALFAKMKRSSLTEEVMMQGQVCRLCGCNDQEPEF